MVFNFAHLSLTLVVHVPGFRYELYCASKAGKTTQITLHCDVRNLIDMVLLKEGETNLRDLSLS